MQFTILVRLRQEDYDFARIIILFDELKRVGKVDNEDFILFALSEVKSSSVNCDFNQSACS